MVMFFVLLRVRLVIDDGRVVKALVHAFFVSLVVGSILMIIMVIAFFAFCFGCSAVFFCCQPTTIAERLYGRGTGPQWVGVVRSEYSHSE